jgi:hypothetical protein
MIHLNPTIFLKIILPGLLIPLGAIADQTKLPGPLVTAEWLAENIENVLILDVRKDIDSFITLSAHSH